MLKDTSQTTVENLKQGETYSFFISNVGEVIGEVIEVTSQDIILKNPLRAVVSGEGIAFVALGVMAQIKRQNDDKIPTLAINRSMVVFPLEITESIRTAYQEEVSDIQIATGNVENYIGNQQKKS